MVIRMVSIRANLAWGGGVNILILVPYRSGKLQDFSISSAEGMSLRKPKLVSPIFMLDSIRLLYAIRLTVKWINVNFVTQYTGEWQYKLATTLLLFFCLYPMSWNKYAATTSLR